MADQTVSAINSCEAVLLHGLMIHDFLESLDERREYTVPKSRLRRAPQEDSMRYLEQLYGHGSITLNEFLNPSGVGYFSGTGVKRWPGDIDLMAGPGQKHESLAQFCNEYFEGRGGEKIMRCGLGGDEHLKEKAIQKNNAAKGLHTTVMLLSLTPQRFRDILANRHRLFSNTDLEYMRGWLEKDGKAFRPEIVERLNTAYAAALHNDRTLRGRGWEDILQCTPQRLSTVIGIDCRFNAPAPLLHPTSDDKGFYPEQENPLSDTVHKFLQLACGKMPEAKRGMALVDFALRYTALQVDYTLKSGKPSSADFDNFFRRMVILHIPTELTCVSKPRDELFNAFDTASLLACTEAFVEAHSEHYAIHAHSPHAGEKLVEGKGFISRTHKEMMSDLYKLNVGIFMKLYNSLQHLSAEEKAYLEETHAGQLSKTCSPAEAALLQGIDNFRGSLATSDDHRQPLTSAQIAAFHKRLCDNVEYVHHVTEALRNVRTNRLQ